MIQSLKDSKVLVLVSNGVDEGVMSVIQRDLLVAGADVKTIGTEPGLVNSWTGSAWGVYFPVDAPMSATLGSDFDMIVVPSGERAIAKLLTNPHCERIISSFVDAEKPMCFVGDAVKVLDGTDNSEAKSWAMCWEDSSDVSSLVSEIVSYFKKDDELKVAA